MLDAGEPDIATDKEGCEADSQPVNWELCSAEPAGCATVSDKQKIARKIPFNRQNQEP